MTIDNSDSVWIFNGENARFPSGVFTSLAKAESWVRDNHLTGILTEYPLDIGILEWAIKFGHFSATRPDQQTPKFIGRFTSASMKHLHFEDGLTVAAP